MHATHILMVKHVFLHIIVYNGTQILLGSKFSLVPKRCDQMVQKNGGFQPGQVPPWAKPLPPSKGSKNAANIHVFIL